MKPFVVRKPTDETVQIPFSVELPGDETLEFSVIRMQYLSEPVMRKMRDDLKAIDDLVQQTDYKGELMFYRDDAGEFVLDDDDQKMPVMSLPQRSHHERVRLIAETMLKLVLPAATFKKLQKLTVGELDEICGHWTTVSATPLEGSSSGESSASSSS